MNSVSRDRQRSFAISRMMAPRSKSYSFLGGANFDSFSITFSISFVAASLIFIFSFAFKKLNYDHAYSQNVRSYDSYYQRSKFLYLTDQKFHTTQKILFLRQTCQIKLFSCQNLRFLGLSLWHLVNVRLKMTTEKPVFNCVTFIGQKKARNRWSISQHYLNGWETMSKRQPLTFESKSCFHLFTACYGSAGSG